MMVGIVGCDTFAQSAPTPLLITATPEQMIIIVTNTPTPSASPVLAPTLEGSAPDQPQGTPEPNQSNTTTTPTAEITLTPTFTITPTDTPATPGAVIGVVGGGAGNLDIANCPITPSGGFAQIFINNPDVAAQIGCPIEANALSINNAFQPYQNGVMVWVSSVGGSGQSGIYSIYNNGTYQRFNDTWIDGVDPVGVGAQAPNGLLEPIRGFGKVWRENAGVSDTLGWATSGEAGGTTFIQTFERGEMIYIPQNGQTYIFISGQPATWVSVAQPY